MERVLACSFQAAMYRGLRNVEKSRITPIQKQQESTEYHNRIPFEGLEITAHEEGSVRQRGSRSNLFSSTEADLEDCLKIQYKVRNVYNISDTFVLIFKQLQFIENCVELCRQLQF